MPCKTFLVFFGSILKSLTRSFLVFSETTIIVQKIEITGYSVGFTKSWIFWNCIVGQLYAPGCPDDLLVFNETSYPELKIKFQEVFAKE